MRGAASDLSEYPAHSYRSSDPQLEMPADQVLMADGGSEGETIHQEADGEARERDQRMDGSGHFQTQGGVMAFHFLTFDKIITEIL
jgi:hypothetical protein